jgi:hypothetical protein
MNAKTSNGSVEQACVKCWPTNKSDCNAFVKAVASLFGVELVGQANDIVSQIRRSPWTALQPGAGVQAKLKAEAGYLVVGGLQDKPNGHVVVVVPGPLDRGKYPTAYWGKLHHVGNQKKTLNYAWVEGDRDKVIYGYVSVADPLSDVLSQARKSGALRLP